MPRIKGTPYLIPGFSFIEVMAALVILSMSLIVLLGNQQISMRMVGKARSLDTAVQLAEVKMTELVQTSSEQGLSELKEEEAGEFDQEKFSGFRWASRTKGVPMPDFAKLLAAGSGEDETDSQASNAALFAGPLQSIGKVWAQALRELHVEILWTEGTTEKSYELVTHLIAPEVAGQLQGMIGAMTGGSDASQQPPTAAPQPTRTPPGRTP